MSETITTNNVETPTTNGSSDTAPPPPSIQNLHIQDNVILKNANTAFIANPLEHLYDMIRRHESQEDVEAFLKAHANRINVNDKLKNGDTLLCISCNKGLESLVKLLVDEYKADINMCRSLTNISSYSVNTPSITITARRQSRLLTNGGYLSTSSSHHSSSQAQARGDSPLSISVKYGFEPIAEYLIDKGTDISGFEGTTSKHSPPSSTIIYHDFEKSPIQEAIRLNRAKIVDKMLHTMFEREDLRTIQWVFEKRFEILRQVLMTENLETLRVVLPNIIENKRIDGEMLLHILNYLLMKSKIQERKEKVNQILEMVMEVGTMDDAEGSYTPFEIYNLDIFIRGFLATIKALFNAVGSDDSRTSLLHYRTSLFYFIMKYQKSLHGFEQFYADIDATFDFLLTKIRETGENVFKLVEYFISFYDMLITMNHIHLTSTNVASLLRLEHVKKLDILAEFLIQRSLTPKDLSELARLKIKDSMHTYNLYTIMNLPVLDQKSKEFLYFVV